MKPARRLVLACVLMLLAACAAPQPSAPVDPTPADTAMRIAVPDLSCRVAGDCEVKNVGNCCGYFPACVNKDSAVDAEAVRAECARTGTSSVCGWRDIQACDCVQGQCAAIDTPIGTTH